MSRSVRDVILVFCAFAVLSALAAWAATGARMFTRYPSEAIEASSSDELTDLFGEETGLSEAHGEIASIENQFTFGLLPSGPGRDALSVAGVVGLAALVAGVAFFASRRGGSGGMGDVRGGETTGEQHTDKEHAA